MSRMKGVKQATLFQSWGNQKKETTTGNNVVERPVITACPGGDGHNEGVIDLCGSFDDEDDELLYQAEESVNQDLGNLDRGFDGETDDNATEANAGTEENECNISIGAENFTLTQRQSICRDLPGFDMYSGKIWIYPTNYPVRDYQYNIAQQALFKNTMVTLPTGLGKTFIAAVVMYNFYRWYPQGKVIFMAPTKPLVAQQIEACYNIMGIPQDHTAEMTGSMKPQKREKAWQEKRIFFLTPQVITNDLSRGSCPAEEVKCLVIDEAHKALGNHAYCQVVRELVKYTENFRVLALSATPGSDIKAVQQVLTNLNISHIEIRTEESIDIKQYSHERKVEKVVVPLGEELTKVKEKYIHIMDVVVSRLKRLGVLYNRDTCSLSKFLILKSRDAFRQNPPERLPRPQYGVVEADYALAMSLYHGFELLQLHGSRSLYNFLEGILSGDKGHGKTRAELSRNADFCEIMELLKNRYSDTNSNEEDAAGTRKPFVTGHPKMEKLQEIVLEHFTRFADLESSATRVMIFSQYRDSVQEITDMLNVHQPLVKAMSFIGQSSAGKATKGFTQKEQLKVMKQFREGGYNSLVSTCVGEEGLDIGDVDLIICFDAHKSPIRLVQRMGRTGRKREGRIVMLVTQGKEEQIYNQSQYSKRSIHKAILNGAKSLHFYQHSPRMVPENIEPKPHKMFITVKESFKPSKRTSDDKKTGKKKKASLNNEPKEADDGDYDPDMAAHLSDDVLKPGGSDTTASTIRRKHSSRKLKKTSKEGNRIGKKPARRSDALRDIEDDNHSSDDDLPAFDLSPKSYVRNESAENKHRQELFMDMSTISAVNLEIPERLAEQEHGKTWINETVTSKKKVIGSRAKSLERKMSESILRKSKKRNRKKDSLNCTTFVDLIVDHDSNDFDDECDRKILNDMQTSTQSEYLNERSNIASSLHSNSESLNMKYLKISSPPSLEDAVVHCEGLDDTHFVDGLDLVDLMDDSETENFRRLDKSNLFTSISDGYSIELYNGGEDTQSKWYIEYRNSSSRTTADLKRFFDIRIQNDILLNKLYDDNSIKSTGDVCDHIIWPEFDNDRRLSSETRKMKNTTQDHDLNISSASLVSRNVCSSLDSPGHKMIPSRNANDSWFLSSKGAEIVTASKTQNCSKMLVKDFEKNTQVTFTQALAFVHSSNGSESESVKGKPKRSLDNSEKQSNSVEYESNSTKNLPIPGFGCSLELSDKEMLNSTGQFSVNKVNENILIHQAPGSEQNNSCNNATKNYGISNVNEDSVLNDIEQSVTDLEQNISDDQTDLPQFDLGFDIDDGIIPPSPNATQQSQKCVPNSTFQCFASRIGQGLFNPAVNENAKDNIMIDREFNEDKKNILVCSSSESKLSVKSEACKRALKLDSQKDIQVLDQKTCNSIQRSDVNIIQECSDCGSDFESKPHNERIICLESNTQNPIMNDENDPEQDDVLRIAEIQSSLAPVGEASFCLMDGDDMADWFDSEPETTENILSEERKQDPTEKPKTCPQKSDSYDKLRTSEGMKQNLAFVGSILSNNANKAVCPKSLNSKAEHTGEHLVNKSQITGGDNELLDRDEETNRRGLNTPVSKFKNRKSVFTEDDFSPDPFSDSFDFDEEGCSKMENMMTSLKVKTKSLIESSTPKQWTNRTQPFIPEDRFDRTINESVQPLKQKENLPSESESDDSFVIRKKKKMCIIESPCSQIENEGQSYHLPDETVFKTPFREKSQIRRTNTKNNPLKSLTGNKSMKPKMSVSLVVDDDDDFDDTEMTKKMCFSPRSMTKVSEYSSDEDFDKQDTKKKKVDISEQSPETSSLPNKVKKKRSANPFIEEEAELSDDVHDCSTDESEHSDVMDHYEASFIHDTEQFSQSQSIDQTQMHAIYMKSVMSPAGPGRFKLKYDYNHADVFSQIPEEESQYMEDSFCVDEEEDEWLGGLQEKMDPMEITMLNKDASLLKTGRTRRQRGAKKVIESGSERAQYQGRMKALDKLKSKIAQKNKNKHKENQSENRCDSFQKKSRINVLDLSSNGESEIVENKLNHLASPEIKVKKKRFKLKVFSSSDEDEDTEKIKVKMAPQDSAVSLSDNFVQDENNMLTNLKERPDCFQNSEPDQVDSDLLIFDSKKSKNNSKGVILVDSKEINGSQNIISDLRFKHAIQVSAAQLPGCDYIISNRMAVERKQWSEFSNGANREKLIERIWALNDLYDRPILIVEKDRIKPGEEKHSRLVHWTKYVDKTIALLLKSSVKVLYTDTQQETATLLADLCQLEIRKGMGITAQVDLNTDQVNKVKFLASIPKLSYINALNLAHGFKSISEFINSSIQMIQSKGFMSENRAIDVYKFLRRQFDANMLPS